LAGWGSAGVSGFAVVDLETTGLYPLTDRVLEVAIVHLDEAARLTGKFCTLVDPQRDVGPTRIHGLKASDVVGAPVFLDVAAAVWDLLRGRVLVAHNAAFDARFLAAEFARCGARLPPPPVMCTMALAAHYLPGGPARSLDACCRAAGVALGLHHSALDDAVAAAALLQCFWSGHEMLPESWAAALAAAAATAWVPQPPHGTFRPVTRVDQIQRRNSEQPPLVGLVDRLPRGRGAGLDSYLGVLDRVLEDRFVSDAELATVSGLATELGLTRETAEQAHRLYLQHVCEAAWRDGQVTNAERADLLEVARLVGVPAGEALALLDAAARQTAAQQRPGSCSLVPGDRVVLTGDMSLPRSKLETLAATVGLKVTSSVSRKTALVVAADPYTQSGKAQQARELGVRMVTDQVFLHMLDEMQPVTA
jgi:DNA polymerase III subunit epsilon